MAPAVCVALLLALAQRDSAVVMVDKPVTVAVAVSPTLRSASTVILRMEGVDLNRAAPAVWNVFWEWPQATGRTSRDNVHFAGYIALPANTLARNRQALNLTLELPPASLKAIHQSREVRLTFVPVGRLPAGGVSIAALRLQGSL